MRLGVLLPIMIVPTGVAVYTVSFGLWLLRRGNLRGACGAFVLAAATVAAPMMLLVLRG